MGPAIAFAHGLQKAKAVEIGHLHVRDDDIGGRLSFERGQSLNPAATTAHLIIPPLQHLLEHGQHIGIVFEE